MINESLERITSKSISSRDSKQAIPIYFSNNISDIKKNLSAANYKFLRSLDFNAIYGEMVVLSDPNGKIAAVIFGLKKEHKNYPSFFVGSKLSKLPKGKYSFKNLPKNEGVNELILGFYLSFYSFKDFNNNRLKWANSLSKDPLVKDYSKKLYISADKHNFCYLYNWLGEPMLQTPDDVITIQELMYQTKPDIILEIGVAWAGTLLLYETLANFTKTKKIIGVDIFIPKDLKKRIFSKSKSKKIKLIKADSTSYDTFKKIKKMCGKYKNILIHLDSDHTKKTVLKESCFIGGVF